MLETSKDGTYYYLDINKINEWISTTQKQKKTKQTEKETIVNANNEVVQIIKREFEQPQQTISYRFELIKDMLNTLYGNVDEIEDQSVKPIEDFDQLTIVPKIILNTLIENEFIVDKIK